MLSSLMAVRNHSIQFWIFDFGFWIEIGLSSSSIIHHSAFPSASATPAEHSLPPPAPPQRASPASRSDTKSRTESSRPTPLIYRRSPAKAGHYPTASPHPPPPPPGNPSRRSSENPCSHAPPLGMADRAASPPLDS